LMDAWAKFATSPGPSGRVITLAGRDSSA